MEIKFNQHTDLTPDMVEAERIINNCVHCGFCTATCPTYRLTGDELDGPRGRIYLIKGLLEGTESSNKTQRHMDRCLTCLSCETHCPSGVEYGKLLDVGRRRLSKKIERTIFEKACRFLLKQILPFPKRFKFFLGVGRFFRFILPRKYQRMIPERPVDKSTEKNPIANEQEYTRKMVLFSGCVQPSVSPGINHSAVKVLNKLGVEVITATNEGCCGAINHHLADDESALNFIKKNIDAWWSYVEEDLEAIIISASGCGAMIKEYGYLLRNDPEYQEKAKIISELSKDISEVMTSENLQNIKQMIKANPKRLVFQNPCSLQHGQKLNNNIEDWLKELGYQISIPKDAHQCCGSAGTYSLLERDMSESLRVKKIKTLEETKPDIILTANIGCQLHLQQATDIPVKHWVEVLEEDIQP